MPGRAALAVTPPYNDAVEWHAAVCVAVVPQQQRHLALALLCELGLQRAGLAQLLGLILLLLDLWTAAKEGEDNRVSVGGTRAPLLPLLSRLAEVEPSATAAQTGPSPPPTAVWLQWLELPEEPDSEVDLQQAAVTVMSHLDRCGSVHIPARCLHIN